MKIWILPKERSLLCYPPKAGKSQGETNRERVFYRGRSGEKGLDALGQEITKLKGKDVSIHWVGEIENNPEWTHLLHFPLTLFLDHLPTHLVSPFKEAEKVYVPSYYLKEALERKKLFSKEKIHQYLPLPEPMPQLVLINDQSLKNRRPMILVAKEYVTKKELYRLMRIVQILQKEGYSTLRLNVLPKENILRKTLFPTIHIVFTGGEESQSLALFHLQMMGQGVPIITTDVGDRGEWVLHGHSGFLLRKKDTKQDWIHYLYSLVRNTKMRRDFGENGRLLIESQRKYQRPVLSEGRMDDKDR
ncbi:glycosyltransferase [Marininema mesophilum]|uniref:glycosyltransferase n=1 Tax=Marininema mesophilum TaxID=1048340 RepID=UPI000B8139B8|nr:glycosyltransferase [Marininema mesophilum]